MSCSNSNCFDCFANTKTQSEQTFSLGRNAEAGSRRTCQLTGGRAGRDLPRSRRRCRPGGSRPARPPSPRPAWPPATAPSRGRAPSPLPPPQLPRAGGSRCPQRLPAPGFHSAPREASAPSGRPLGKHVPLSRSLVPQAGTATTSPVPVCLSTQAPKLLDAPERPGHGDSPDLPASGLSPKC